MVAQKAYVWENEVTTVLAIGEPMGASKVVIHILPK